MLHSKLAMPGREPRGCSKNRRLLNQVTSAYLYLPELLCTSPAVAHDMAVDIADRQLWIIAKHFRWPFWIIVRKQKDYSILNLSGGIWNLKRICSMSNSGFVLQ
ncbi:MAG: hypothetical protein JRH18_08665 [Deltaproteobacteria bacterium]|nr:hypothetical protein [Deltaproteobacteria bacterium]MBW2151724.1 hypothetical protein [Deltaproteobacteria bacterium]